MTKWEKKLISGPILARFAQIWAFQIFFCEFYLYYMLDFVASYHCIQFQGKPMIQTQENNEKPHFGPDLGPVDPNSGANFFFRNLALSVTRYHGQLSLCTISEKTNDPLLRIFSVGWMDGQTL